MPPCDHPLDLYRSKKCAIGLRQQLITISASLANLLLLQHASPEQQSNRSSHEETQQQTNEHPVGTRDVTRLPLNEHDTDGDLATGYSPFWKMERLLSIQCPHTFDMHWHFFRGCQWPSWPWSWPGPESPGARSIQIDDISTMASPGSKRVNSLLQDPLQYSPYSNTVHSLEKEAFSAQTALPGCVIMAFAASSAHVEITCVHSKDFKNVQAIPARGPKRDECFFHRFFSASSEGINQSTWQINRLIGSAARAASPMTK